MDVTSLLNNVSIYNWYWSL